MHVTQYWNIFLGFHQSSTATFTEADIRLTFCTHFQCVLTKIWVCSRVSVGCVGLWGFLWRAPSTKRKDRHRISYWWSSTLFHSNTGLSSTQYEQIPIIFGAWPFWLTPFFFSVNNILAGLWLNCISFVETTLFLLADILLQHMTLFQC